MLVDVDGAVYHAECTGFGPPLVVLHGFTGSAAAMRDLTALLQHRYRIVAIDLPGHGGTFSYAPDERFHMRRVASDLVAVAARLAAPRAAWFGYSLGGRVALNVAVQHPGVVDALALLGASPGIADPAARAARVSDDKALATRIERDGVASFVTSWERLPLFASQVRLPQARRTTQRVQRLLNVPRGLGQSLRGMGAGVQVPVHDRLAALAVPALLLAGAEDEQYRSIAASMAEAIPGGVQTVIDEAGHAAHLEQPASVARAIDDFLSALPLPQLC